MPGKKTTAGYFVCCILGRGRNCIHLTSLPRVSVSIRLKQVGRLVAGESGGDRGGRGKQERSPHHKNAALGRAVQREPFPGDVDNC